MQLTGTYYENEQPRHPGVVHLSITGPEGDLYRAFSTRTAPRGVPLRQLAEQWAREHGHRLTIDWSSLAA